MAAGHGVSVDDADGADGADALDGEFMPISRAGDCLLGWAAIV